MSAARQPSAAPDLSEAEIRAELNQILDPCSVVAGAPAGIEQMGLIRELSVREAPGGLVVQVRIGVTEPGCMMGASFVIKARERLAALPGVAVVNVELDHAMDWEPEDIDPRYAKRLAAVREARTGFLRASDRPGPAPWSALDGTSP